MVASGSAPGPLFGLGRLVATRGALAALGRDEIGGAIGRHASGDWGDLCREDRALNVAALRDGGRLLSAYVSRSGVRFYVITEWDRSLTTVLLASEY